MKNKIVIIFVLLLIVITSLVFISGEAIRYPYQLLLPEGLDFIREGEIYEKLDLEAVKKPSVSKYIERNVEVYRVYNAETKEYRGLAINVNGSTYTYFKDSSSNFLMYSDGKNNKPKPGNYDAYIPYLSIKIYYYGEKRDKILAFFYFDTLRYNIEVNYSETITYWVSFLPYPYVPTRTVCEDAILTHDGNFRVLYIMTYCMYDIKSKVFTYAAGPNNDGIIMYTYDTKTSKYTLYEDMYCKKPSNKQQMEFEYYSLYNRLILGLICSFYARIQTKYLECDFDPYPLKRIMDELIEKNLSNDKNITQVLVEMMRVYLYFLGDRHDLRTRGYPENYSDWH